MPEGAAVNSDETREVSMADDHRTLSDGSAPPNLRIVRARDSRMTSRRLYRAARICVMVGQAGLVAFAMRKRLRGPFPVACLTASGLAILALTYLSNRRHSSREAALDAEIEQSFPASDPTAHY
jgi:hypothetical protein